MFLRWKSAGNLLWATEKMDLRVTLWDAASPDAINHKHRNIVTPTGSICRINQSLTDVLGSWKSTQEVSDLLVR